MFYYPLAGRIIELENNKKLVVDCTGEGILFVEADAHVELDKLGDSIKPPCPYLDQLLYNVPGSDGIVGCPLLLVQIIDLLDLMKLILDGEIPFWRGSKSYIQC
ncbi:hypothetical protein RND71_020304 [Anisodus tanguticus]|uniref:Uncharacterized protein n=1 Tax=Anisodus tanguticus TaxID=243964 RepID=A0AAE1S286_9SOLA|nr:hypothetical protein RND71_020304 [Anisodus tanguticus]